LEAEVSGVIPGSPAARAGLTRGDVIKTVRGRPVHARVEAFRLLQAARCPALEIERRGLGQEQIKTARYFLFGKRRAQARES